MAERIGIMLAYPFSEKYFNKFIGTPIIQPKLDGVRARAILNAGGIIGDVQLLSSSARNIQAPIIIDRLKHLALKFGSSIELDGELWSPEMTFEEVNSLTSRTVNIIEDDRLNMYIFDAVSEELRQVHRLELMSSISGMIADSDLSLVEFHSCQSYKDVLAQTDAYQKSGYEGAVVKDGVSFYIRKRSRSWLKLKPEHFDTYTIVDMLEEMDKYGNPKGSLGAFIVADADGNKFGVGSGLKAWQRIDYWYDHTLIGKQLKVKYHGLTAARKVPRHPVFVEVLDEAL